MKEIGGYFGLEIGNGERYYHNRSLQFQSARSALHFILESLRPSQVYVPFYTCNALLKPIADLQIPYHFYAINADLEIGSLPELTDNELIIYINYFDVKRDYVDRLSAKYGAQLLVDCSQAYFLKGNGISWYFNSTRKFFGVPDGADLYVPIKWNLAGKYKALNFNNMYTLDHLIERYNGKVQDGYRHYLINEELIGLNNDKMSLLSRDILSHLDYKKCAEKRHSNFLYVHEQLKASNLLKFDVSEEVTPSFYPYLPEAYIDKTLLWQEQIYVPIFWSDCFDRRPADSFASEKALSKNLIPVPVDHRYHTEDLKRVIAVITKLQ